MAARVIFVTLSAFTESLNNVQATADAENAGKLTAEDKKKIKNT